MAKRICLSSVSTGSWETDWTKCCLCQEDTAETLKLTADGYKMLAINIPKFHEMNSLPIPIDVRRFNNGSGIENTLTTNEAKYHPSCRIKFNNTKLKRVEQRYESAKSSKGEPCCSPKFIRRPIDHLDTKLKQDIVKCFLCDKEAPPSSLREVMTMKLNDRLKSCAETLQDKQLLAKLSTGDVIAQDLKYHPACLAALYNKERAVKKRTEEQAQIDTDAEKEAGDVALAELVNYVFETQRNSEGANAFRLADLSNMYEKRVQQLNEGTIPIHRTRLKEMLLAKIPDLQAYTKGREVLLVFEKDVGPAIALACNYDDTIHIGKTAEIIRAQIKEHKTKFSGSFSAEDTQSSVPTSLLELVCMIEHGPDIQSQLENSVCKSDLAIAQLLMYNYHAKTPKISEQQRHAVDREPPFCIYIGLLIFARTRKRHLIDILFQYGLCISYHRVLEISTQLGDAVVERFLSEGLVCPPVLNTGLFTTAAVDNIDHNPSSTTAKTSFHGTGISILQHPSDDISGIERGDLILGNRSNSRQVSSLPDTYANVRPAYLKTKPKPPNSPDTILKLTDHDYLKQSLQCEFEWLNEVHLTDEDLGFEHISWSSYHSSKKRGPSVQVSLTSLMPLFEEQAHSVAMIKHSMDKVKEVVAFLNPGQTPIITADQPLFVLAKQIQWEWPNLYGEDKFVVMFGGLHIEMACFKILGDILRDSGWTSALTEADIATSGTADSFLVCSNVPRTRHAHQITVCVLFELLMSAYESINADNIADDSVTFDNLMDWCTERESTRPKFNFWRSIMNLELLVLSVVRSFRESDFLLYKESLSSMIPYFFGLYRVNYARWLPIHLRDMASLHEHHPQVAMEFANGNFTVRKTNKLFSNIAIDHAHEQNNAIVKGDGGAIGLTEDPSALRRWMVAGPEVSRLVEEFEISSGLSHTTTDERHHEDSAKTKRDFFERVQLFSKVMTEFGNPFLEESSDLYKINSKEIVESEAGNICRLEDIGSKQYEDLLQKIQNEGESAFYDPIKKNNFPLFSRKTKPETSSSKTKLKNLKSDCDLFSRLFISCQSRQCDLEDFFSHENQTAPPSLSQDGTFNSGNKSQLMDDLESFCDLPSTDLHSDAFIVDGQQWLIPDHHVGQKH